MAVGDRFCPSCGTEVDADARFCPVCGTLLDEEDPSGALTAAQPELPAAPGWPESTPGSTSAPAPMPEPAPEPAPAAEPAAAALPEEEEEPEAAQPAPAAASAASRPTPRAEAPWTLPETVSGWLIGIGSALGAILLLTRLSDLLSLLLFLGLLGVVATVFLADRLPEIPRQRVLVLAVLLVGLGISLERAAFRVAGIETLLLLALLAAAGGALLVELDRDRPMPPPAGLRR